MWFYCSKAGGCRYINSYDFFFYFSKKKKCSGCKYMFRSVSTMSCLRESFGDFRKKIWKKKYSNNGEKIYKRL